MTTPHFVKSLLGFRVRDGKKTTVPNIADGSNEPSKRVSRHILSALNVTRPVPKEEDSGSRLEVAMRKYVADQLDKHDRLKRNWTVNADPVTCFAQYRHLASLQRVIDDDESGFLAAEIGSDYIIEPDVAVGLHVAPGIPGGSTAPLLHAAISCKWTLRSDRAQNVRHEAVIMIRHRRGRLPHIIGVTMEPLPLRIASMARGTGEIDVVFHPAFDLLREAVRQVGGRHQQKELEELVRHGRLRPLNELAGVLLAS